MKKFGFLLLFAVALIIGCSINIGRNASLAHPGRTDSQGGHYDHSSGTYHFHNGGGSSSGSSSISLSTPKVYPGVVFEPKPTPRPTPKLTPRPTQKPATAQRTGNGAEAATGVAILISFPPIFLAFYSIVRVIKQEKEEKEIARRIFDENKEKYRKMYGGKSIEDIVKIPEDTEIGPDGLPKTKGAARWGYAHTVYISRSGEKYHRRGCRYAQKAIHAYYTGLRKPCSICKPKIPNYEWYAKYREIERIKKKYDIE